MKTNLERALEAEEALEVAKARIGELELLVKSAMKMEPLTASRALAYKDRADKAVKYLKEFLELVENHGEIKDWVSVHFITDIESHLQAAEILKKEEDDEEQPEVTDEEMTQIQAKFPIDSKSISIAGKPVKLTEASKYLGVNAHAQLLMNNWPQDRFAYTRFSADHAVVCGSSLHAEQISTVAELISATVPNVTADMRACLTSPDGKMLMVAGHIIEAKHFRYLVALIIESIQSAAAQYAPFSQVIERPMTKTKATSSEIGNNIQYSAPPPFYAQNVPDAIMQAINKT